MALVDRTGPILDRWVAVTDAEPITPRTSVIVTPKRLNAEGEALFRTGAQIGVFLPSDAKIEDLAQVAARLGLIGLRFAAMKDGRPFTLGRILRTRMAFKGELRAVGEIIPDQVPFLVRCGFTTFEVPEAFSMPAMRRALSYYAHHYQRPAANDRPVFELRRAGGPHP
ncbi:MAG: DUF934 domain-containing protein [Rhodospirillaceae bacterium]|nr:DUF934 domain-containing protein [Rhodospirillaceae bacterium]